MKWSLLQTQTNLFKRKMEIDTNKAKVCFKEDVDIKEQVAFMVGFGLQPPVELKEHLIDNPHLSQKGQITANEIYKRMPD